MAAPDASPHASTPAPVVASGAQTPAGLASSKVWLYGSLGFPIAIFGFPLGIWLPRAYATGWGIDIALVGWIIFGAAMYDAVTDPAVGWCSDRYRTRWGRRKVWVAGGMPVLALATFILLNPPAATTALTLALTFLLFRTGTTLFGVPYGAWGVELSGEYHMRTRIQSARQVFLMIGLLTAASVPIAVEMRYGDETAATDVLIAFSWIVVVLLPAITLLVVARVPEPPATGREGQTPFLRSLTLMGKNKLFLLVVLIELLISGGEQFRNTLSLFFMQEVIGAPRAGWLYFLYFGMGLAAIPFWNWLARTYGKHRSLAGAMILVMVVSVAIFMLEHGQLTAFYVLFALKGFCFGAFAYLPAAMLADVIDIDTARSGDARPGSYLAAMGFVTKCTASLGGLSLPLLSLAGFSAQDSSANGPTQLLWLGILYALVPTATFVLALYLCWTWPLTSERHARLRAKLERRNARLSAQRPG